jgi:metallophosphoesterase superfamily enzyme
MAVEPIPGESAAVAAVDGELLLLLADYHAGIEHGLRREGVELDSRADARREAVRTLIASEQPDRLVVLGDLGHAIGDADRVEREEIRALFDALPVDLAVTVAKGNHDGGIETVLDSVEQEVTVTPSHGAVLGDPDGGETVGVVHGHTWPARAVLDADVVCLGHEHPVVRLEDEVGGRRVERVWLRGAVDPAPFAAFHDADFDAADVDGDMVVFPAFNDRSGGTWVNVEGRGFLSPFLPEGLADGEAYLLDGTRLGVYERV